SFRVPIAGTQVVRRVLDQRGNDVLARRRQVWVHDRRHEDIEERCDRDAPIFRVVVRPLQVFEGRTDPEVRGDRIGGTGKWGRPVQGEVHLRNDTVHFEVPYGDQEFRIQLLGIDQVKERPFRIRVGGDRAPRDPFAV